MGRVLLWENCELDLANIELQVSLGTLSRKAALRDLQRMLETDYVDLMSERRIAKLIALFTEETAGVRPQGDPGDSSHLNNKEKKWERRRKKGDKK